MIRALAALFLTASTAVAACPTSADLDTGIVVQAAGNFAPENVVVKHLGGGLYWTGKLNDPVDGDIHRFQHLGLFPYYMKFSSDGEPMLTSFDTPTTDLIDLVAGMEFENNFGFGASDGSWSERYERTESVTAHPDVTIGDCTYATVMITNSGTYQRPNGVVAQSYGETIYVPELRIKFSKHLVPRRVSILMDVRLAINDQILRDLVVADQNLADILALYDISTE